MERMDGPRPPDITKKSRRFRLPGHTVASQYVDLGEVDPAWHKSETIKSQAVSALFETIGSGGIAIVSPKEIFKTRIFRGQVAIEDEELVGNLTAAVTEIDQLYRGYKELPADTVLRHRVTYRAGRARSSASVLSIITGNILPISGPGFAHYDSFLGDNDAVLLNRGGNPTRVFLGPVRNFDDLPGFSRLLLPPSLKLERDRAALIDRYTLHKQSAQVYTPLRPGIFLRSIISIVPPQAES